MPAWLMPAWLMPACQMPHKNASMTNASIKMPAWLMPPILMPQKNASMTNADHFISLFQGHYCLVNLQCLARCRHFLHRNETSVKTRLQDVSSKNISPKDIWSTRLQKLADQTATVLTKVIVYQIVCRPDYVATGRWNVSRPNVIRPTVADPPTKTLPINQRFSDLSRNTNILKWEIVWMNNKLWNKLFFYSILDN